MKSLRSKILAAALTIVAICQIVTVVAVLGQARKEAERNAVHSLEVANSVVASYLEDRQSLLHTAVRVLSDDFGFRAAVASADTDTVTSVLRNHASRVHADYAVIYDADGTAIASTSRFRPELQQLGNSTQESRTANAPIFFEDGGTIYQSVLVPVLAPVRIGWVAMGFAIDDALADQLSQLTGTEVSFLARIPVGRPMEGGALDRRDRSDGSPDADPGQRSDPNGDFVSIQPLNSAGATIYSHLHLDRDTALQGYDTLAMSMIVISLGAALFAGLIAIAFSRRLTLPLSALLGAARRIGRGDYSGALIVSSNDEIGELASTLDAMQSEIELREQRIRQQASHDALTGLPNRSAIAQHIETRIVEGSAIDVMVISFQGIQEVNSALGLELGDSVVQAIARELQELCQTLDCCIARLADTRFCIALRSTHASLATDVGRSIIEAFDARPVAMVPPISVKAMVGVAQAPLHGTDSNMLIRKAWMASMESSPADRQVCYYDERSDTALNRRRQIVSELIGLTGRDELHLAYQPKYAVARQRIACVEALLRWRHPQLGFVPPDEFIPLAETSNSIRPLTRWVVSQALQQVAAWDRSGLELDMAVNVSPKDISDPTFPGFILGELDRIGLAPNRLELEITETAVADDPEGMFVALRVLRRIGIRFAIDDFGTGMSSLSQLKQLPVDTLKIDKSFVMHLATSESDQQIVRSTINLAHNLGLQVVAEGVEDLESARMLQAWGCDLLQGYLLAKPLAADTLPAMLESTAFGNDLIPSPHPARAASAA